MRGRRLGALVVAGCLAVVAIVTLAPYAWTLNRLTVRLFVFFRTDVPIAPAWMTPEDYGNLLNLLLFVPVGAVLAWWLGRRWAWALPLSVALSAAIEGIQTVPAVGREASLTDVVSNAAGAAVGVAVVAVMRFRAAR